MTSPTLGRVATFTLVLGLLGLAGCNRPAEESPMGSSSTGSTSRPNAPMSDSAASMPMPSASSARP